MTTAQGHPSILLRHREIENFADYEVYCQHGGYQALRQAIEMDPSAIIDEVKASGLRGRGGAGFPTGVKWSFIPPSEPLTYVVVNADESETGTFKDREIMEGNPHQLLEGALICARAIRASAVYIYLRGEFWDIGDSLDERIAQLNAEGLAGKNILGSGWDCDVFTHLGAGAYICGEESALLESLEGKLGMPRVRPPFPAQKGGGLYFEPTVVNNVETLANVPWILEHGAAALLRHRHRAERRHEGLLRERARTAAGQLRAGAGHDRCANCSMIAPAARPRGGNSRPCCLLAAPGRMIPTTDEILDTLLSYEGCAAAGTILGSASVVAMDDSVDMTWVASKVTKFFRHESCGKCTPCREGTYWLDKVLDRILAGEGRAQDIRLIDSVAKNMQGATLCALGDFAANPIIHTIAHFPADFHAHFAGANGD